MDPKLWQIMSALVFGPQPSYIVSADGDAGGDNGGGGGGGGGGAPPKTFTQEQLDTIIEKRLAKERGKFADYDEIKTQLSLFAERRRGSDAGHRAGVRRRRRPRIRKSRPVVSTTPIADVATDADISDELSAGELANVIDDGGDAEKVRQKAFDEVLKALPRRIPPIAESMLVDVTELKDSVVYGALSRLYLNASHGAGDTFHTKHRFWQRRFEAEVNGLVVTLPDVQRSAGGLSIPISRR